MKRVLMLLLIVGGTVLAQEPPMLRGPGAQRIEQFKKIRMMEVLKLDEETSLRFFARYNKHQEELRAIATKRDSLLDLLDLYRRRGAADAEYEKAFKSLVALGHDAVRARENFITELHDVLSVKQIAEYLVFERRFYENLRDVMREMQRERRGMMR